MKVGEGGRDTHQTVVERHGVGKAGQPGRSGQVFQVMSTHTESTIGI